MKKKIKDGKIIITGLICLTAIELFALSKGIDGVLMSTIIGLIALTIGIKIPTPKFIQ